MPKETPNSEQQIESSRLLNLVRAAAISPDDARTLVERIIEQVRDRYPDENHSQHQDRVAEMIVSRYSKWASLSGGATALVGVVPGLGTVLVATGGAIGDAALSMKFQVDMAMCLATAYGYDLNNEDARNLSLLIAAGGTLEKAGVSAGTRIASQAGVRLLRQYLKGAVLQAIKELFKKLGIIFTRKALEKALPFGIGVVVGATANYYLTRYVGREAIQWFRLDRESGGPEATLGR